MQPWRNRQEELKEGGAPWCASCMEYGHLRDVCPYEDPLFLKALDQGKVEDAEEWLRLKATRPVHRQEPERPQPKREEPERPQPKGEEPERPTPEWEEPERPTPDVGCYSGSGFGLGCGDCGGSGH